MLCEASSALSPADMGHHKEVAVVKPDIERQDLWVRPQCPQQQRHARSGRRLIAGAVNIGPAEAIPTIAYIGSYSSLIRSVIFSSASCISRWADGDRQLVRFLRIVPDDAAGQRDDDEQQERGDPEIGRPAPSLRSVARFCRPFRRWRCGSVTAYHPPCARSAGEISAPAMIGVASRAMSRRAEGGGAQRESAGGLRKALRAARPGARSVSASFGDLDLDGHAEMVRRKAGPGAGNRHRLARIAHDRNADQIVRCRRCRWSDRTRPSRRPADRPPARHGWRRRRPGCAGALSGT